MTKSVARQPLLCISLSTNNDLGGQLSESRCSRRPTALERARADRHRAVHGHPRRRDRERRAAVDQDRSRFLAGEPAVGDLAPTRSSSAVRCCSAAGSPTCSGAGGCSSAGLVLFARQLAALRIAWSEGSLIAFRALQGLGGALLAPAALSLLMTTFAEGRERNLALGIYGAASGSGAAAGVLLGGVLTRYLSWSWIFFVNVPVGDRRDRCSRRCCCARAGPTSRIATSTSPAPARHRRADAARLRADARDDRRLGLATPRALAASVALLAAFVAIELRSRWPLLPLRIFRLRTLAAANVDDGDRRRGRVLRVLPADALPAGRPRATRPSQSGVAFAAFALHGRRRLEPRAGDRRTHRRAARR